jgi:hypothetical protein
VTNNPFRVSLLDCAADRVAGAVWVHDIIVRQVSGERGQNSGSFERGYLVRFEADRQRIPTCLPWKRPF